MANQVAGISASKKLSLLFMLVLFFSLSFSLPAKAHDQLISSSPETDEVLTAAPKAIELIYSAEIMEVGADVRLLDAEKNQLETSEIKVDGAVVYTEIPELLVNGEYSIIWRVVSSDGHPIDGVIPFKVAVEGNETAEPSPMVSPDPTPEPTVSATSESPEEPNSTATPSEGDGSGKSSNQDAETSVSSSEKNGSDNWLRIAIVAAVGGSIALISWVLISRKSNKNKGNITNEPQESNSQE